MPRRSPIALVVEKTGEGESVADLDIRWRPLSSAIDRVGSDGVEHVWIDVERGDVEFRTASDQRSFRPYPAGTHSWGVRAIYVLTHDSIGLGEDGPTHQPVEHFAMLRATPNLQVFRPCDAVETAECWELALAAKDKPSALLLSRQNLPTLRTSAEVNESARGAFGSLAFVPARWW